MKSLAVIDSSTALKWVVSETDSEAALRLRDRFRFIAPELLIAECANAVWKRVRKGEINGEVAKFAIKLLQLQTDDFAFTPILPLADSALQLAVTLDHPIYDCLFIALAVREGCPFITSDGKLLRKLTDKSLPVISVDDALALPGTGISIEDHTR